MQRGCRNTVTNSRKSVPSLFAGAADVDALPDFSAALIDHEIDIAPAKITAATPATKSNDVTERLIPPPSYAWAACGFASQSPRTPHSQSPAPCTARPALQCRQTSHYFPQCVSRSPDSHSSASPEKYGNLSASTAPSRM